MRYEVVEQNRHGERVVTTVRRENGAVHERDRAADASYFNFRKRTDALGGYVARGQNPKDPHAVDVVYTNDEGTYVETFTYRPVGGWRESDPDLTDVLLASIVAVTGGYR